MDALTANVTACVRLKSQSSRRQRHMRKLTASATPKTDIQITAGADHCDVTMPRAQRGMLVENLKKKKRNTNHCKCQRGTECSLTFIQLRLHTAGRAATLNIPPSARVPSEHLDLQLVIDNADNKKKKVTCVHQSKLANESQNAVHIHIWNTAVLCQPA